MQFSPVFTSKPLLTLAQGVFGIDKKYTLAIPPPKVLMMRIIGYLFSPLGTYANMKFKALGFRISDRSFDTV